MAMPAKSRLHREILSKRCKRRQGLAREKPQAIPRPGTPFMLGGTRFLKPAVNFYAPRRGGTAPLPLSYVKTISSKLRMRADVPL
jgi:hypothetical protein